MEVYNELKTQILTEYDLELGHLKEDLIIVHHEAVIRVAEKCHYDVVAEYPNGGKDVVKVIDAVGVPNSDAFDEERQIKVYVPYSQSELTYMTAFREISTLEKWFSVYDRKVAEHARCARLGDICHHSIAELDNEAKIKQARIRELREVLDEC